MFAAPRRLNCRLGGEVHARRKVWRARKVAIPTRYEMYEHHPCRAHHKLEWARTEQSVLGVLYELLPRSESSNEISTQSLVISQAPQDQPVFDRDWQQPLNHPPRVKQSSCASNGSRSGPANTTSPHSQPQRPRERTQPLE